MAGPPRWRRCLRSTGTLLAACSPSTTCAPSSISWAASNWSQRMVFAPRPTSIRYVILAMTTLVAVMLYLDRWCLGFFAPHIRDQLRLSQSEIDGLQSAFFVSYAFGQIPCGWLADRFGPRTMLTF